MRCTATLAPGKDRLKSRSGASVLAHCANQKVHNLTLVEVVSFPDAAEALLERKSPSLSAARSRREASVLTSGSRRSVDKPAAC